jgi:FtsP/CotA-like multicopper oxidase with cupredoxin domain
MTTRREFLSLGATAILPLAGCASLFGTGDAHGRLSETRAGDRPVVLTAGEHAIALGPGRAPTPAWLYNKQLLPVLRMRRGQALDVTLRNELPEHTSIHWHGVRGPNAMDGVPYLTQAPVMPSHGFRYRFVPPDSGTFFFHPHCDTAAQLGRGLVGALVVEDEVPFDDDVVLFLKDWRVGDDGRFLPFFTPSGASRAGTFGTLRTVNGLASPRISLRGPETRLRIINADATRISQIGIEGADAKIIAIDGNPVEPFALDTWRLGPAMRLDLAICPTNVVRLVDYFAATPLTLATLVPDGTRHDRRDRDSAPPQIQTVFAKPWRHVLELGAGLEAADALAEPQPIVLPDGRTIRIADELCLAADTFWTLDGKSWPGRTHGNLPPPLFEVSRGENVILDLENTTSRAHPIHLHGHTMTVLAASLLHRPVHRADTVLVLPNERVQVGFAADNPGNWMIHCHVIEHQESGMMGWFRVS